VYLRNFVVVNNNQEVTMANPVVHFEVIGQDPAALRRYYGALFGWEFDTGGPVAEAVSAAGDYGFTEAGGGIPGGIGGGADYPSRTLFYVGVPDVEAALAQAVALGGARVSGPHRSPGTGLTVGFLTDPEGHLIGVASGTG
jgi:predicted enzyme related to lactoylglutathione lyase